MATNSHGKRPCSICRKWFQPDVRQKSRQKTCSPACRKERHRRQCEQWNRKNKAVHNNNYLARKLEQAENQEKVAESSMSSSKKQTKPVLPTEVIVTEYGIKPAVIIQHLVAQVIKYTNNRIRGFPWNPPSETQTNPRLILRDMIKVTCCNIKRYQLTNPIVILRDIMASTYW